MQGVSEIFGIYCFTYHVGIFLICPFLLAFIISFAWAFHTKKARKLLRRGIPSFFALCTIIMTILSYWDGYQISRQATKLCKEEAGVYIYRQAEAKGEGICGLSDIEEWSKYGFAYVESEFAGGKKPDISLIKTATVPMRKLMLLQVVMNIHVKQFLLLLKLVVLNSR